MKAITSEGYTIDVHIVRPKGLTDTLPVFMFIHGGGCFLGSYPTHERLVQDIVVGWYYKHSDMFERQRNG